VTTGNHRAYVMKSVDGKERLMVIRSEDVDLLKTIARKISKIRNADAKAIAAILEGDLND
jgi:hypothetical protein